MLNYFYLALYASTVLITCAAWMASHRREYFWITLFISLMYAGAWSSIWHEPSSAMFVDLCAIFALYVLLSDHEIGRRLIFFTFLMVLVDSVHYAVLLDIPRGSYYAKTLLNILFACQCVVSITAGWQVLKNKGDLHANETDIGGHKKVLH